MKRSGRAAVGVCVALLLVAIAQAQGVYKWVDADGKVHYGSQPPAAVEAPASVKLHNSNSGFGGDNNAALSSSKLNPDGTKKVPKEVEEFRDGGIKALSKIDPKKEALSCSRAVENVQGQFDAMLEVGQRNTKDGYVSASEYETTSAKIRKAKSETTAAECETSSGNKRAFFQCMSSNMNHILGCSKRYPF